MQYYRRSRAIRVSGRQDASVSIEQVDVAVPSTAPRLSGRRLPSLTNRVALDHMISPLFGNWFR
jgi:hypothetical protein